MLSKLQCFALHLFLIFYVQNVFTNDLQSTIRTDSSSNGELTTSITDLLSTITLQATHSTNGKDGSSGNPSNSDLTTDLQSNNLTIASQSTDTTDTVTADDSLNAPLDGNLTTETSESSTSILAFNVPIYDNVSLPDNFTQTGNSSTVCYGVLGCFGRRDFFDPLKRPINLWPQSPETINVAYKLYTGKNKFIPNVLRYDIKEEDILATNFDPKKPTKFIIHGFGGSFDDMQWMGDIKDLIFALTDDKYNVIGVDWSQGTNTIVYMQSVANTRVVGAATAYFISKLVEYKGVNVQDIHLIGHSLGAHVSGYVGERFREPQIGHITGLDPAGPDFYADIPGSRLDRTDAAYVDAIHTDYGNLVLEGFGIWDTVGMDDFYPNGGYRQPGCGITTGLFNVLSSGIGEGATKTFACNHQRSWGLFIVNPDNMDEHCQYVGYECGSWDQFRAGQCGDCGTEQEKCGVFSVLGPDDPNYGSLYLSHMNVMKTIETKNRRLYFKTDDQRPFCLHHYQIVIHIANDMPREATGFISLNLHGSRRSVDDFKLGDVIVSYKAGMKVTALGTWVKSLGAIQTIELKWTFGGLQLLDPTKLFNFPKLHVKKIEVNYLSNFDPEIRKKFSSVLCPKDGNRIIKTRNTGIFEKCVNMTDIDDEPEVTTSKQFPLLPFWPFGR